MEGRPRRDVQLHQARGPRADQCGAGIPAGAKLAFILQYASGITITANTMNAEKSEWSQAGINVTPDLGVVQLGDRQRRSRARAAARGNCRTGVRAGSSPRTTTRPGEEIFQTGAGSNSGNYSDPTNDANIMATNTTGRQSDPVRELPGQAAAGRLPAELRRRR